MNQTVLESSADVKRQEAMPLVSCIMPTRDHRPLVAAAIRNFLSQDHTLRELIVIDDGNDSVADLMPPNASVQYVRMHHQRSSVGSKRNIACEMARGDVISHWDDEDWMHPGWLSSQVATLINTQADIVGLDRFFWYSGTHRKAWEYRYDGRSPWVFGGTLCYQRAYWKRAPFGDIDVGEGNAFVRNPQQLRIATNPNQHLYVAQMHADSYRGPPDILNRRWHSHPVEAVERLMRISTHPTAHQS